MNGLPLALGIALVTIEGLAEIAMSFRNPDGKPNWKLIVTLIIGVAVAMLMPEFDVYKAVGVNIFPPIAGRILSGILASRGAKLFHDFLGIVEAYKVSLKSAVK